MAGMNVAGRDKRSGRYYSACAEAARLPAMGPYHHYAVSGAGFRPATSTPIDTGKVLTKYDDLPSRGGLIRGFRYPDRI